VYKRILNEPKFSGQVVYNGRQVPFSKRAAEIWKYWMYEAIADVSGVLNSGPAAGIALATILISAFGGKLSNIQIADDMHPIDTLRLFLAADVIRDIPSLGVNIANSWSDALERIADRYTIDKNDFVIVAETPSETIETVRFPFLPMREVARLVA